MTLNETLTVALCVGFVTIWTIICVAATYAYLLITASRKTARLRQMANAQPSPVAYELTPEMMQSLIAAQQKSKTQEPAPTGTQDPKEETTAHRAYL